MEINTNTRLNSRRCSLRYIAESDIPHIFSASQYEGFTDGMLWSPPESQEELNESFQNNITAWREGKGYCFTIESIGSAEFLGRITIRRTEFPAKWNIGFWTHPEHQGNGYMAEAVQLIVEFGFKQLNAKAIQACYAVWNKASESVLHKNGFEFVKYLPQGFFKNGKWVEENLVEISSRSGYITQNKYRQGTRERPLQCCKRYESLGIIL